MAAVRAASSRSTRWVLLLLVFTGGMTTMALEMAASRLLGPYFGDSILVWANLIGLILIYLTLGSFLGGKWADRSPRSETLYTATAVAAFWVGMIPMVAAPILRMAQNAFTHVGAALATFDAIQLGGSFVSVLILLAPPVVLLGMISPFAIRISTRQISTSGSNAGRIYALSTVGSILGTFLPVLLSIPTIGTARTFLLSALVLFLVSLLGLILQRKSRRALVMAALLILLVVLMVAFPQRIVKADSRMVYEQESRYNYIQVLQVDDSRYLMLNEGQGVHSIYNPHTLDTFGTWDMFVAAPFFNPPERTQVRRMCIVGLAAGTVARQATAAFGPIPIDGVEIDPAIVDVGRMLFDMNMPNLHVFVTDGRFFLQHTDTLYDLIVVDAYRLPYIPFQLTTTEFFALTRAHLTADGAVTVNVGRTETDYRMVAAVASTLSQHFATVHAIDIPETFNTVLVATVQTTTAANLQANATQAQDPFLRDLLARAVSYLQSTETSYQPSDHAIVFTDDRAPVESMTNALLIRYLLAGE